MKVVFQFLIYICFICYIYILHVGIVVTQVVVLEVAKMVRGRGSIGGGNNNDRSDNGVMAQ